MKGKMLATQLTSSNAELSSETPFDEFTSDAHDSTGSSNDIEPKRKGRPPTKQFSTTKSDSPDTISNLQMEGSLTVTPLSVPISQIEPSSPPKELLFGFSVETNTSPTSVEPSAVSNGEVKRVRLVPVEIIPLTFKGNVIVLICLYAYAL